MKKFLLSIFAVMLAVFSVQAEEVTFNFKDLYGSSTLSSIESKTVDGITISYAKNSAQNAPAYNKDGTLRLYYASNGAGGSATFTTDGTKKITKVVITATTTPTVKYSVDGGATATGTWSSKTMTISNIQATKTFEIQNANTSNTQLRISSIVLTCEEIGGGETPEPDEPEIPVAPAAPTLTASCSFDDAMTVEITDVAEGATAYYLLNNETDWVEGTSVEITETTTVYAKAVKDELSSVVVSATYTKNEPVTPPAEGESNTVTFTASANGYSNGAAVITVNIGDYITATFGKGTNNSNAPKYYTTGSAIRCYGGNTFTIASTAGNITEIVLTFASGESSNAITANVGSYSNSTWTGAAQSVTFTVASGSGHRRIAGITVTYAGKSAGEPEIINVEQPVISSDKAEYAVGEEAVVTITTATEGATIYYSLDGSEPTTVYTEPIVLDETTTVKAVAKMEGANDSPLAEKIIEFKKVVTLVNATVAEVIAAYESGDEIVKGATVVGYIVGAADGSLNKDGNFSGSTTVRTNLLLADDPNETDVTKCIPVELPSGVIRTDLNLADHPEYYKKKVVLTGNVLAYFSVAGLKSTSAYEFVEEEEPVAETWSSFYAAFPVAIPEGVEAYIVTAANAGYVTLTQIYNAVPANTGVILKGGSIEATNDNYYSGAVAEVTGNLLQGTMTNTYISEEAYVLGKVDGVIGLYKAEMNQQDGTAWLNNANKAYLPASVVPAAAQGAANFSFRFGEGTTGIDEMTEQRAESKEIYDLTGRRVETITERGVYIVGGKKVLVK